MTFSFIPKWTRSQLQKDIDELEHLLVMAERDDSLDAEELRSQLQERQQLLEEHDQQGATPVNQLRSLCGTTYGREYSATTAAPTFADIGLLSVFS